VKILAVDDEPQILRALRTSLTARGHDVLTAPNGETALDLLSSDGFELVVLDLGYRWTVPAGGEEDGG
jgi:two-component system, OmpR family, KDP operon response regulator KdpE